VHVIQGAGGAHEALGAEDLLGVEGAIGATELDVSLRGKVAELHVVGHA
jgi:hypothetical protein